MTVPVNYRAGVRMVPVQAESKRGKFIFTNQTGLRLGDQLAEAGGIRVMLLMMMMYQYMQGLAGQRKDQ